MIRKTESEVKCLEAKHMTIPIFIPHLGCGHACTFCNQKTISGVENEPKWSEKALRIHIEQWLSSSSKNTHIEIGFFGGSFTGIPEDLQDAYLAVAKDYLDSKRVQGIRLSTRPDYLGETVIERLKKYGVTLVELGVQSFSDQVLSAAKRGHDSATILGAVRVLKEAGIPFGIQLMIGLHEDSPQRFLESVKTAISLGPSCVRIYPTLVLADTQLAYEMNEGKYLPLSLDQAVELATDAYLLFIEAQIPVIRMGLQATETLSNGEGVLAGPHHDAFRTLVESEVYRRQMERDLENGLPDTRLSVRVHPKHVSFFSGHKKANLNWLKTRGIEVVRMDKSELVEPYQIEWHKEHEGKR